MLQQLFKPLRLAASLCAFVLLTHASQVFAAPMHLMDAIGGEQPIRLQELQITGDISGASAETTVQMVFFNPNRRALEGNLQFPLLAGQQITAFALDINGKLRPAVPVEKAKGRQVFEAIERRGVDPAILEVTQGNNFKLRVFPIPAGGIRTVQLKFAQALGREGENWRYQLPLNYESELKSFSLTLNANGYKTAPGIDGGPRGLKFAPVDQGYYAQLAKTDFSPAGTMDVFLPANREAQSFVEERGGKTYFVSEVAVDTKRSARILPKVVGLLWDSSGSATGRALGAEISELDTYFKAIGNGEVRLTRLRDKPEPNQSFTIVNGDWHALRKALQETVYDGASALADWKPESRVDEYILVSDGLLNYGSAVFPALGKNQRLYALNSAAVADTNRLAAVAERSGGRLIQVDLHAPGAAAHSLLTEGVHLSALDADGAINLQAESADPEQGVLRVAGILQGKRGTVHLTVQNHGTPQQINIPITADAPNHPLAAHFWASYRLHALEAEPELQRAEIRRIGQEFGIPTSETSLIVLETVADYVRYDIEPPADYRQQFDQLRSQQWTQKAQQRQSHLESVVQQFHSKLEWWEGSYKAPVKQHEDRKPVASRVPATTRGVANSASQAQPMAVGSAYAAPRAVTVPPPSPPAYAPSQSVVITGVPIARIADHETPSPVQVIEAQDIARTSGAGFNTVSAAPAGPALAQVSSRQELRKSSADESRAMPAVAAQAVHESGIQLKRWSSDAPYISRMKAAGTESIYAIYLDEKPSYLNSSAFFLDAADLLKEKGQPELALRVLSNLAEMDLENRQVLRILGYRLMELGAPDLAIPILKKVQLLAEDEPQSFRDLGLAYAADKQYQAAIDQLNEVVVRSWDGRFRDIEMISLAELNAIVATKSAFPHTLDTSSIDPRLLKNMPLDLRVTMTWDADDSDMDLWVTDPSGEKCFYSYPLTTQGGHMSADVTQGYGPEEFSLRRAHPGKYKVEANFYGNRQQTVAGATTLQVKLTTGFGTAKARDQMVTLRLKDRGETVFVGEFEVK